MTSTVAPPAPALAVEPRDCLVCGGTRSAAIGHHGYRCLTCKSEYVNPELPWSIR
jgi:predicted Zn-ribbon and HTH transcriptional regulator